MVDFLDVIVEKAKRIGIPILLVAAAIIGLQFYFVNVTEPVPNYNNVTNTIYRTPNDYVVLNPITNSHAMMVSALTLILVYLNAGKDKQEYGIITHHEARAIVEADIENLKLRNNEFKNVKTEVEGFVLKRISVEDKTIPNHYIFFTKVEPVSPEAGGDVFWARHELNPFTGGIERWIREEQGLTSDVCCSRCGGDTADFKIVMSSVIQDMKAVRTELGMQR